MPAKKVGIYFGLRSAALVEQQGRRIANHSHFALPIASGEPKSGEEKQSSLSGIDEVKIVAKIQEELRNARVEAKEAILSLSEKDVFVRFFDIPSIPREEWDSAIYFEVKKYLPFRPEDLVYDYQSQIDKQANKINILFVAAKKEVVDTYISIMGQAGLKVSAIEPAPFSLLRVLKLGNQLDDKKILAVIDADAQESTITIVENGMPYFSRDIKVVSASAVPGPEKPQEPDLTNPPASPGISPEALFAKFTNEIRISLDYYRRQVSAHEKEVEKIIFLGADMFKDWVEFANRELDIPVSPANLEQALGQVAQVNSSLIKAFGASLRDMVPSDVKLNLADKKQLALPIEKAKAYSEEAITLSAITQTRTIKLGLFIAAVIAAAPYAMALPKIIAANKELKDVIISRPPTKPEFAAAPKKQLDDIHADYIKKLQTLDNLVKNRAYLTFKLNVLPQIMPDGVVLTSMDFQETEIGKQSMALRGIASLGDEKKEFDAVNTLLNNIKENGVFKKTFKDIGLVSANRDQFNTRFEINCK